MIIKYCQAQGPTPGPTQGQGQGQDMVWSWSGQVRSGQVRSDSTPIGLLLTALL